MRARSRARPRHNATLLHLRLKARGNLAVARKVLLRRPIPHGLLGREESLAASGVVHISYGPKRRNQAGGSRSPNFLASSQNLSFSMLRSR